MKIVYLDAYPVEGVNLKPVQELGDYTGYENTSPEKVVERAGEADILIVNKIRLMRPQIDALPRLKLICVSATGVNNVDIQYAAQKGIPVKNVAGYSTESVAEATLGIALALLRNLAYYDRFVKSGDYSAGGLAFHVGRPVSEIRGKTWGIIGLGTIGRRVATLAEAFGAQVVYHSTSGVRREENYPEMPLEALLSESDVVSIHSPLNERTGGMIGSKELKRMKPTSVLINVARGGIVDETALAQALENGMIAGAGLDVFEQEPIGADNPLLKITDRDRLILSPHSAWTSLEARARLIEGVARNIREFLNGR